MISPDFSLLPHIPALIPLFYIEETAQCSRIHPLPKRLGLWMNLCIFSLGIADFPHISLENRFPQGRYPQAVENVEKCCEASLLSVLHRPGEDFYTVYSFFPAGNGGPGMEYNHEGVFCPQDLWMNPRVFPQFIQPCFWGAARAGRGFPQFPHPLLLLLK